MRITLDMGILLVGRLQKKVDVLAIASKKLRGKICWGIDWCETLGLSMSFGPPHLFVLREPYETRSSSPVVRKAATCRWIDVRGRWWLWVYSASWQIERNGKHLASLSSSLHDKRGAFRELKGQKFVNVHVNPCNGMTRFQFDLDTVLELGRMSVSEPDDLWRLYQPDETILIVRPDGRPPAYVPQIVRE